MLQCRNSYFVLGGNILKKWGSTSAITFSNVIFSTSWNILCLLYSTVYGPFRCWSIFICLGLKNGINSALNGRLYVRSSNTCSRVLLLFLACDNHRATFLFVDSVWSAEILKYNLSGVIRRGSVKRLYGGCDSEDETSRSLINLRVLRRPSGRWYLIRCSTDASNSSSERNVGRKYGSLNGPSRITPPSNLYESGVRHSRKSDLSLL